MDSINQATLIATLIGTIIASIVSVLGAVITIFKIRPDVRKTNADGDSAIADAAESVANGSKISNEMLMNRIKEMEELGNKRDKDLDKIKEKFAALELELTEWKDYAFRLTHQVKSLGYEPVPFKKPTALPE